MPIRALLINPWITDFAAFDLWARPLGLLMVAARLRREGWDVRLVDCLDRRHPQSGAPRPRPAWPPATGQWLRTVIPTPPALAGVPRHYARYGLPMDVFRESVVQGPRPDVILVTSSMTYWYPGVRLAVDEARGIWPDVPVALGGIYAQLCADHAAAHMGADLVAAGPSPSDWVPLTPAGTELAVLLASPLDPARPDPRPALDLYPDPGFLPLLTSRGCPNQCPYCASHRLFPMFRQRDPQDVLAEVRECVDRHGIRDITFFDDALLLRPERHIAPILEGLARLGNLRLHAPNGLHVAAITPDLARLMKAAGFHTIRLGLETLDPGRADDLGGKASSDQFFTALDNLAAAGFPRESIGAYALFGLPGQDMSEVLATARAVRAAGARPYLAEYTPVPGTELFEQARAASIFDLAGDPLRQNNVLFPCRGPGFTWEAAWAVKRSALGEHQ